MLLDTQLKAIFDLWKWSDTGLLLMVVFIIPHSLPHNRTVGCRNGHCRFCHDKNYTGFNTLALYEKDTIFHYFSVNDVQISKFIK